MGISVFSCYLWISFASRNSWAPPFYYFCLLRKSSSVTSAFILKRRRVTEKFPTYETISLTFSDRIRLEKLHFPHIMLMYRHFLGLCFNFLLKTWLIPKLERRKFGQCSWSRKFKTHFWKYERVWIILNIHATFI